MDWGASGIKNSFEFEAVNMSNVGIGTVDGILGGKITESYRGDYRSTCTLDYDGLSMPDNCGIRVWHTAELGDEIYRHSLGTFFMNPSDSHLELGRRTGSLNLYSSMFRMANDYRVGNRSIKVGTDAKSHFESVVKNAFCAPSISAGVKDYTTTVQRTWEHGVSSLSEAHTVANQLSGMVVPDAMGNICLVKYVNPKSRPISFTLATGKNSVLLLGVDISEPEIVNKVIVSLSYTKNETTKQLFASAEVSESHRWHPNKIGRWVAVDHQMPEADYSSYTEAQVKQKMADKAASVLKESSSALEVYSVKSLYTELQMGQVGTFIYSDSDGESINKKVMLTQREISLNAIMETEMTLEALNG